MLREEEKKETLAEKIRRLEGEIENQVQGGSLGWAIKAAEKLMPLLNNQRGIEDLTKKLTEWGEKSKRGGDSSSYVKAYKIAGKDLRDESIKEAVDIAYHKGNIFTAIGAALEIKRKGKYFDWFEGIINETAERYRAEKFPEGLKTLDYYKTKYLKGMDEDLKEYVKEWIIGNRSSDPMIMYMALEVTLKIYDKKGNYEWVMGMMNKAKRRVAEDIIKELKVKYETEMNKSK